MLTRRLEALVESGLLERQQYSERPGTTVCADRAWARLLAGDRVVDGWGNKHFAPGGGVVLLADKKMRRLAEPKLIDTLTGTEITSDRFLLWRRGPKAGRGQKSKYGAALDGTSSRSPALHRRQSIVLCPSSHTALVIPSYQLSRLRILATSVKPQSDRLCMTLAS